MSTQIDPHSGKVVITNREIYDQLMKVKSQVAAMWVTHGIIVVVLGGALVNTLK